MASKSLPAATTNLGTTNTTPANNLLAASSAVNRWVRGITVTNVSGGALTWNFGIGTAAIMTAANSLFFGKQLDAGAVFTHQFPGKGRRLMTPATDVIMGFASGAGIVLDISYDEELPS